MNVNDLSYVLYPVGLFDDLRRLVIMVRAGRWGTAKYRVKRIARQLHGEIKYRELGYFNGFLAAPINYDPQSLRWTRVGHGWTRRRALADLHRHLEEMNP